MQKGLAPVLNLGPAAAPLPLSILSFSLSPPPLVAVFSAALHPGPGSVSMVTGGSKASAGQPGL